MPKVFKKQLFNQRGITLIELIAVILILGIIAAVGIPVVLNQVELARVEADNTTAAVVNDAVARYAVLVGNNPAIPASGTIDIDSLVAILAATTEGTDGKEYGPFLDTDFDTTLKSNKTAWDIAGTEASGVTKVGIKEKVTTP